MSKFSLCSCSCFISRRFKNGYSLYLSSNDSGLLLVLLLLLHNELFLILISVQALHSVVPKKGNCSQMSLPHLSDAQTYLKFPWQLSSESMLLSSLLFHLLANLAGILGGFLSTRPFAPRISLAPSGRTREGRSKLRPA